MGVDQAAQPGEGLDRDLRRVTLLELLASVAVEHPGRELLAVARRELDRDELLAADLAAQDADLLAAERVVPVPDRADMSSV